jgi:hypothetical protein
VAEHDFAREVAGRGDSRITPVIVASGCAMVQSDFKQS